MRRLLLIVLLTILVLTCTIPIFDNTREVFNRAGLLAATNIDINETPFVINTNIITNLTVSVLPNDHNATIVWSIKDTNLIRLLESGKITSLSSNGSTILTATAGNVSDSIEITVEGFLSATNIVIDRGDFITVVNDAGTLTATVSPNGHTDGDVSWSSSDEGIFSINTINGQYTANTAGTVEVTALVSNVSDTIEINVIDGF